MGKRKRRIEGFAFYDHRGICNHLEQMAEKGWKIRQIGVFWEYEAIEPRKMHFAVSCCAGEDGYFKGDKGEILHLEKWRLVCRSGEMAIFCCEEEEAPPFGSMAKEELEAVHTIMKKEICHPGCWFLRRFYYRNGFFFQRCAGIWSDSWQIWERFWVQSVFSLSFLFFWEK